ncbi:MAG: M16 family metallopeptidase [Cyclobacteriaceae bacterium]
MKHNTLTTLLTFSLLLSTLLPINTLAQEDKGLESISIPKEDNAEIPLDESIIKGKLENGLTYYIRRNAKPEERVELRLAVNAGSLMEDDDQLGLAHFTEHMAFNGTENFEKNELVNVLQMAGVKFGAHLNAYTSFDETVYILKVPTTDTILEQSLQILEDWASGLSFDEEEIDKERGVVIEEWRIGQGAQRRMQDKFLPVVLAESRYASRLPIGTKDILENFDYQTLKRFYEEWYRPDLMAVVAVGDIDPRQMEKEIKSRFGYLKAPPKARERSIYDVPVQEGTSVVVVTDKEATYNQLQLIYKQEGMADKPNSVKNFREVFVHQLFTGMLNQRLSELTQQADPPFMYAASYYGNLVRSAEAFQLNAVAPENGLERALEVLLEESEKIRRFGFTQTELDRYKTRMLTSYETSYKERDKTESARFANEYVRNFFENEPAPGVAFEYKFAQEVLPGISLEQINSLAEQWIKENNRVVVVMAPEKEGVSVPTETEVREILDQAAESEVTAYQDEEVPAKLIEDVPSAAAVTSSKEVEEIGVTELTFDNGLKVVLKPTDFKDDEILMLAHSPGGYSVLNDDTYFSAANADGVVQQSGVKDFTLTQLEKYLADKSATASPFIAQHKEGFSGESTKKDLETMLQLAHLYFTAPRMDQESFQSYISKNKAIYANLLSNPQYYYQDQLMRIMSQDHPRAGGFPSTADWEGVTFDEVTTAYADRFQDASDFTFFLVGNFDVQEITPLLARYLGSLPDTEREEKWKDEGIRPPSGVVTEKVMKGNDPKSMVNITFHGEFDFSRKEAYEMNSLVEALNIKLIEEIREKKSGVYGISARANAVRIPYEHYSITVNFPCAPENVEDLSEAVFDEIEKLKQNGPTPEDLKKVKEAQLRQMETNLKENSFWLRALEQAYFVGQEPTTILDYNKSVDALSAADLQEAAKKYFNFDQYVKVVLYPEEGVQQDTGQE